MPNQKESANKPSNLNLLIAEVESAIRTHDTKKLESMLGHDHPLARDRAWGEVLKLGGAFFSGIVIAASALKAHELWAQSRIEAVLQDPISVPPKRVKQIAENLIQHGRGMEFAGSFLRALDNIETRIDSALDEDAKTKLITARDNLFHSFGPHSSVTAIFFTPGFLMDLNSKPVKNQACSDLLETLDPKTRTTFEGFVSSIVDVRGRK